MASQLNSTLSSDSVSNIKRPEDGYSESEKESSAVAIDKHLEKMAQWKIDLVIIPLVGMYCT